MFTSDGFQQKCDYPFDHAVRRAACIDVIFKLDDEVCTTFVPVTYSALPSVLPEVCVCVFMNFWQLSAVYTGK